jgi:hypothetical protein
MVERKIRGTFPFDISFKATSRGKEDPSDFIIQFLFTRNEERFTHAILSISYLYHIPLIF